MVARVRTVAFQGIDVVPIDVQVQIAGGSPNFMLVGLPDKAVGESRERIRAALAALGLALPPRRITVNLSPADLAKEGSHYDLPIALGLMAAIGIIPTDLVESYVALGELALDGALTPVAGVLPAAMHAASHGRGIVCPAACGGEAAWGGFESVDPAGEDDTAAGRRAARCGEVVAAPSLLALINHFKGTQVLAAPQAMLAADDGRYPDLRDVKGQESAKRALEVVAAGAHNLLLTGPPGAGKSMLAARLPGLLPPLEPDEALEVSMVQSMAGQLGEGKLTRRRPFRDPHHSASLVALVGGGMRPRPGEVSLAHHGVLFLDELPEFNPSAIEALRQPLETGRVTVARANAHVTYPARFLLVAAMNPCRCGHLADATRACGRAPRCGADYQGRISGPLYDRIDLAIDVPPVAPADLALPPPAESTADVAARVLAARARQRQRFAELARSNPSLMAGVRPHANGQADGELLTAIATPDADGRALLARAVERLNLSARGYHRVLRVARTLADLDASDSVRRLHIAEALSWRRMQPRAAAAA
ncbi:YifB family Mg chelatase-like AAA ATPase [Vineibacter terrae]|uniref:YifB family Mg chelatase-like AAA ATPase n=1 Tax=Vineibacter terrae TaxID=2586908 RepID=A0A5C8PUR1_9HYPH|nr:YifB family Mg chelatase-like AAA ATPase [Vineibacter terrae]TXL81936.1 YifB family Mg chelatase-like AAA ATPase [Vineibacter terrae]